MPAHRFIFCAANVVESQEFQPMLTNLAYFG